MEELLILVTIHSQSRPNARSFAKARKEKGTTRLLSEILVERGTTRSVWYAQAEAFNAREGTARSGDNGPSRRGFIMIGYVERRAAFIVH